MIRRLTGLVTLLALTMAPIYTRASDDLDRAAALLGMARVKRDAHDLAGARRFFEDARRLRPFGPSELAEYFWVVADVDAATAVALGRDVLAAAPTNHDVRDRLIALALANRDEKTAAALATEGRRIAPATARWPRRLGESYLRQNRPAMAVEMFRAATRQPDADARDRASLAVAFEAAKNYAEALATWATVPSEARTSRPDWERSRLRALAHAGSPAATTSALEAWLRAHPQDDEIRAELVEFWARLSRPDLALEALAPLLAGPTRARWVPREIQLALATGAASRVIDQLSTRVTRGEASTEDRWTLATALVNAHLHARAETAINEVSPLTSGCDDRAMQLLDRMPDPFGTDALLRALQARGCADRPQWIARGITRTVALGRHAEALSLVQRLPGDQRDTLTYRRLEGQLHLWTGDAAGAAEDLAVVVRGNAADDDARWALVSAERALGQAERAWATAAPLVNVETMPDDRRIGLADLAIETFHPDAALAITARLPEVEDTARVRLELTARAALQQGRALEAEQLLTSIDAARLSPAGALALIDAATAAHGRGAALEISRTFTDDSAAWRDVLTRRITLESAGGRRDEVPALRARLAAIDPNAAIIADAETALAAERPHDALAALDALPPAAAASLRAVDLRATALVGIGDFDGATPLLAQLTTAHPDSASFAIRAVDLRWRRHPAPDTMQAMIDLPARWPGQQQAAIAAATALAADARFADALRALGPADRWMTLPADGRLVAARSLHAMGRSQDAVVLIDDLTEATGAAAIDRARIVAAVRGSAAAAAAFASAAARPSATPDLFLAWSSIPQPANDRLAVLTEGAARFPADASLVTALASAEWALGLRDRARASAARAIALDSNNGSAWFVLVDAVAATEPSAIDATLNSFAAIASDRPSMMIGMAEHLAGLATAPDDRVLQRALAWLEGLAVTGSLAETRDVARVRILAAAEQWAHASQALDRLLAGHPNEPAILKMRAEVLSWAGRHDEALSAYDAYLATAPQDVEARRQQARVASWAGRASEARRLYAALEARVPDDARVAAEARAKDALLTGRWLAAIPAYERWVQLDPANTEARFELAEVLRASGDSARADATLVSLVTADGHRLAAAARARAEWLRRPAAEAIVIEKHAAGYSGQRLLNVREDGGAVTGTFGEDAATTGTIEATFTRAASHDAVRDGYRLSGAGTYAVVPGLDLSGRATTWRLGSQQLSAVAMMGSWRAADRWQIRAGLEREPLFDSITTIDRGLTAAGLFAGAAHSTPSLSADLRLSRQWLSDGNRRHRSTLSASRTLGERLPQWRAVAWAELLDYRHRTPGYFSPSNFVRADGGVEYTHTFTTPRFRDDRRNTLALGYLLGTDSRGVRYQHPTMSLDLELVQGWQLSTRGSWIRSASYNETSFTVNVTRR